MIKYRIITDSSSGISKEEAQELGVTVLPLTLTLDGIDYKDGVDISTDEFYNKLFASKDFPKTSMVSPAVFEEAFNAAISEGYIPVVLPIAACLSGTYQSAVLAKDMVDEDVYVVDSKTALGCIRVLIRAIRKKDYENIEELLNEIESLKERINFYAVPDNLDYLYKGGRLSKTSAVLGNLLQIKPLIQLNEVGKLTPIAKLRGLKHAFLKMVHEIKDNPIDNEYEADFGYSTNIENVNSLVSYVTTEISDFKHTLNQISPVVGAHVGPGASAFFYISKNKVKK